MTETRSSTLGVEICGAAALAVLMSVLAAIFVRLPAGDSEYLPSHVTVYGHASGYQLLIYFAVIALLFAVTIVVMTGRSWAIRVDPARMPRSLLLLGAGLLGPLFLLGEATLSAPLFTAGFALGLAGFALARMRPAGCEAVLPYARRLVYAGGVVFIVGWLIVPIVTPLIVRTPSQLAELNSHYSMTLLPGFDFATGTHTGAVERANYGLSMVFLSALPYRLLPSLASAHEGGLTFIARCYELLAAATFGWAMFRLNRRHFLWLTAIGLAISPTLTGWGDGLYYPNLGGIRFLPCLLAIVVLAGQVRARHASSIVLALIAAVVATLSPETGLVVAAGNGTYVALMSTKADKPWPSLLRSLGLFLVVFAVPLVVLRLVSQRLFLDPDTRAAPLGFVKLFASGYAGLFHKLHVYAGLALFFAFHAILRGVSRARRGAGDPISAFQAAAGAMVIVWMPYYMNHMQDIYVWFASLLVLLLLAPAVPKAADDLLRAAFSFRHVYVAISIALFAGLTAAAAGDLVHDAYNGVRLRRAHCLSSLGPTKGWCVQDSVGVDVPAMLAELEQLDSTRSCLVLSHLSASVRLAGYDEGFPWYEPFGEVPSAQDLAAVQSWIETRAPSCVITDNPISPLSLGVPPRTAHLQQIVSGLSHYELHRTTPSWLVLGRRP